MMTATATFRHQHARRDRRNHFKCQPRLERLEDRLALSGFGPEDGAYIEDPSRIGSYYTVRVQPGDDKIVVAGNLPSASGLSRFDSAGNVDTAYGNAGSISLPGTGRFDSLALQPDGKAVTASAPGVCGGNWCTSIMVARVDTAGSLDSSFGNGGTSTVILSSGSSSAIGGGGPVALQSTGEIVVGGSIGSTAAGTSAALWRFTPSGVFENQVTTSFVSSTCQKVKGKQVCTTPYTSLTNLAIQPNDKIVAVGSVNTTGSNYQAFVARYSATGVLDTSFNSKGFALVGPAVGDTEFSDVALQPDGKILVSGGSWINGVHHMFIYRYNANGTLDTSFTDGTHRGYIFYDIGGFESAHSLAIQPDGKIVTAGTYTANGQTPYSIIVARFSANGSVDSTFGNGGYKLGSAQPGTGFHDLRANGVALQSDGSIIVAGVDYWGNTGDTSHPVLMRFYGGNGTAQASSSATTTSTADATDAALLYMLTDPSLTGGKRKG